MMGAKVISGRRRRRRRRLQRQQHQHFGKLGRSSFASMKVNSQSTWYNQGPYEKGTEAEEDTDSDLAYGRECVQRQRQRRHRGSVCVLL